VDDVDCSVPSFLRSPTNLRAYGADDDKAHPAISVLYSVRVTLTNHYWVTSDERRRASGYFTKAFELREHASERERLTITALYYERVTGDLEKAAQTYQEWVEM